MVASNGVQSTFTQCGHKDIEILKKRKIVYETVKLKNPNKWSKNTRNWNHIKKVYLDNLQKDLEMNIKRASY